MVLIQLLLPAPTSSGASAGTDLFATTREELVERFGGVTAYLRAPAQGVWTDSSGTEQQDAMVMVEVVADRFDKTWWGAYAKTLASRFSQDVIHVRALPADLLDPNAR